MHPAHSGASSHGKHRFAHPARNIAAFGIEPGMKVADFGAGSGAYVLTIAEALDGKGIVYAIDIQKDLLRRIKNEADKRGFTNVDILWGDLEASHGSKLADDSLEFVLISNLLFQLEDPQAAVSEAARILRPGGRLAIIDWNESLSVGRQDSARFGPHKDAVVSKKTAYAFAIDAGLTFVKEIAAGAHHYGLLFRKTKGSAVRE